MYDPPPTLRTALRGVLFGALIGMGLGAVLMSVIILTIDGTSADAVGGPPQGGVILLAIAIASGVGLGIGAIFGGFAALAALAAMSNQDGDSIRPARLAVAVIAGVGAAVPILAIFGTLLPTDAPQLLLAGCLAFSGLAAAAGWKLAPRLLEP